MFDFFDVGRGCGLSWTFAVGGHYKAVWSGGAKDWRHTLWWPAGGRGEITVTLAGFGTRHEIMWCRMDHSIEVKDLCFIVSYRNSCGRGSSPCLLHSTQPLFFRMWMMQFSLKSVLATTATSLTTPVCLWPPPLSSAGLCLMVRNHINDLYLKMFRFWLIFYMHFLVPLKCKNVVSKNL